MATIQAASPQGPRLDRYVVIHVATTCDEHGVYVTKDSAEVIELGWILLDAKSCDEIYRESILVKPVNTPITPLCTSLTTLTWEHVRNSGTFRDAINAFDAFAQKHLTPDNLEFAFVTLDSWDLRVQLPREARDKAVVLPPYLQHSRSFDLRTEYQHWQAHHPESLPFGSSSLSNICAALEVEPVQTSAPIKHNLPFHLQALAPASPRRAMEEAITLTRVLRGLIRKSQPEHDHPDVLTRPMDARADVRAFLNERSKVLHMSGLPHDTTQSELESWFTQFGGRPIAFWTMRTPDQHKPTGSGFAVFSSHEEAAESLCMNGRALNEKAIEVSPSSARVLDRACEVLTPFPPSKNRPRPGDWTCPSCGFSNFQRRTQCFRCSYPVGHESQNTAMQYGGFPGAPFTGYGGLPGLPGMHGPPHHLGGHHGGMGGHHGGSGSTHGRDGGGRVPFRAGDWKCGNIECDYHNFAKNVSCLRCGGPRTNAAISTGEPGFPSPMEQSSGFGGAMMGPPSMATTPGPGPFAAPAGAFGSGAFGPPGGFGAPPSYLTPSMGYGAPGMGMGGAFTSNGGMPPPDGFDARAEAAFASAPLGGPMSSFAGNGASGFGNAHPDLHHGQASGGAQGGQQDQFGFLSRDFGNMGLGEGSGRGSAGQSSKNPA